MREEIEIENGVIWQTNGRYFWRGKRLTKKFYLNPDCTDPDEYEESTVRISKKDFYLLQG